ncbi:MAG: NAD(P)-binding domain-containing protein, partial [Oscillospiraceae bacterium]|nr:NAD(P)-binding domain-containing protein [Oscillospiraceae bacterium]
MNTVVLGSGGWGTALASVLRDNGHAVTLWSHDAEKAALLQSTRENPLLPGVTLPPEIAVTNDLAPLRGAELVVFAAPSFALRSVARLAAPYLAPEALLVSATKGIERGTHLRMSQLVLAETGGGREIVALSGPSH